MITTIMTTARAALAAVGVALMITLTGCQLLPGSDGELTITYDDGKGTQEEWTLTCDPADGSHPDPEAACQALAENADALAPPPPNAKCTMIFGGPQTATITGTWDGDEIDTKLSRGNGCEIDRWDKLEGLVPKAS